MSAPQVYLWNKAPALRILLPFMAGIVLQWYCPLSLTVLLSVTLVTVLLAAFYFLLPVNRRFVYASAYGFLIHIFIATAGALAVWTQDVKHHKQWLGHHYQSHHYLVATLEEPLVQKPNSYKALATVQATVSNDSLKTTKGKIILYFKKEDTIKNLGYGSQILLTKPLQEIKNTGNPGAFDYKRYSLFQGITHQAYLTPKDFVLLPQTDKKWWKAQLFHIREWVITLLKTHIAGSKEQGLAEALLIGYKDDLDKALVQSYANTGVVHVIAISGLHLGLIYGLLLLFTKTLKRKKLIWLRAVIIIAALWMFSLLAGAQASVLRSAVMFTAIALAEALDRKSSIYNTMALSAFLLLCYNPFWLWDVGFQLSYTAVLSIIIFYRPIYNWLYFPNKGIDLIWQLMAITLAAQILTTPISLYHFHQFPLLFFITNLVAVPLSTIILFGEILLCLLFFLPPAAQAIGWLLQHFIRWMNAYIERLDGVTFAVWQNISISIVQTILLLAFIAAIGYWLLDKKQKALPVAIACLLLFVMLRTVSFIHTGNQKKLIVYNVPRYQAIDVMTGNNYVFIGDAAVQHNAQLKNFHLQPARIQHRVEAAAITTAKAFNFYGKKVMIVDTTVQAASFSKTHIDLLILSKNPKLYLTQLSKSLQIRQVIIDGSVPQWKAMLWQKDCDSLKIPYYNVAEKGAFVLNL